MSGSTFATTPLPLPAPFTTSTPLTLLTQGAEALVYRTTLLSASSPVALKYRPPKPYRHPLLDRRLTKQRLLAEARVLVKCCREGVPVPEVVALGAEEGWLALGWVRGVTVRRCLDSWVVKVGMVGEGEAEETIEQGEGEVEKEKEAAKKELWDLMARVGRAIGRMHEIGVCHGDLTTSNLMLRPPEREETSVQPRTEEQHQDPFSAESVRASIAGGLGTVSAQRENALHAESEAAPDTTHSNPGSDQAAVEEGPENIETLDTLDGDVVLIDFGLATQSLQDEDRAVDLYVLERAFTATHPVAEPLFREVLRVYGESFKGAKVVLKRLEDVRMRGRKRSMLG